MTPHGNGRLSSYILHILQIKPGSWAYLVERWYLEVSHPFPLHQRVEKTAPLLRGSFSIFLIEAPALSTSPNVAKSRINSMSESEFRSNNPWQGLVRIERLRRFLGHQKLIPVAALFLQGL
jgi:hypothetical protein